MTIDDLSDDCLLSVPEIARLLGLTKQAVYLWVEQRAIEPVAKSGRAHLFRVGDVRRLLRRRVERREARKARKSPRVRPARPPRFLPYDEARDAARAFVDAQGIRTAGDWAARARRATLPAGVPTEPQDMYSGKGWLGWEDWIGPTHPKWRARGWVSHRLAQGEPRFLPFADARAWARAQRLPNQRAWRALCRAHAIPPGVPRTPDLFYRGRGWRGWGDWLGK